MRVIVIAPGLLPVVAEIDKGLKGLYSVCGSPVEVVPLQRNKDLSGIDLWCNEEGRLNGMPPNVEVPAPSYGPGYHHRIYGPCLIARGDSEGETVGLTAKDIAKWLPIAASWTRYVVNPAH